MELSRLVAFNVCERKRLREIEIDGLEFISYFFPLKSAKGLISAFVVSIQVLKDLCNFYFINVRFHWPKKSVKR